MATMGLSYHRRIVVIGDLTPQANPNLVDLCAEHLERLRPPVGWSIEDERSAVPSARP